MQTTMSRTRRFSTLGPAQTSEAEVDGEEGEAVMVQLSAGEVKANLQRTLNRQLNTESLRVVLHKVPLRQRSLSARQECAPSNHAKLVMGSLIYDVSNATR